MSCRRQQVAPILAPILLRRKRQAKHEVMKVGSHRPPLAPTPALTFLRRKLQAKHQVMKSGSNRLPLAPTPAPTVFRRKLQAKHKIMKLGSRRLPPAPTPAPTLSAGSFKRNTNLWFPPHLLFILPNNRRGNPKSDLLASFCGSPF